MRVDNFKEIIKILMGSRFYFELNLRERLELVMHVLQTIDKNQVIENSGE
jgi:hypothetical protein